MKKSLIVLCLILILLLCACRRIKQPDDTNYASSNSSEVNSDYSFVSSDLILPDRDDPTVSSTSSDNETVTSSDEQNTSSEESVQVENLSIEMEKYYYLPTNYTVSFFLSNERKSAFTYYTDFFLQKYEDGEWEYYPTTSGEIEYSFNTARSDSYRTFIVLNLKDQYNTPLPIGKYRIIQASDGGIITSNIFEVVEKEFFGTDDAQ